jgi:hypothetical protein
MAESPNCQPFQLRLRTLLIATAVIGAIVGLAIQFPFVVLGILCVVAWVVVEMCGFAFFEWLDRAAIRKQADLRRRRPRKTRRRRKPGGA